VYRAGRDLAKIDSHPYASVRFMRSIDRSTALARTIPAERRAGKHADAAVERTA
jgi:hypothetical protein